MFATRTKEPAGKPIRLFLTGVVVVILAIAGFALVSEAFAGGGQTVYLANFDPSGGSIPLKPSLVVTGSGRATAPAERAVIQLLIVRNAPFSSAFTTPTAGSSSQESGSLTPIIDAVMGVGIDESAIQIISSPSIISVCNDSAHCSAVRVDITIDKPVLEKLNAVVNAAGAAAGAQQLTVQDVGAGYFVADCRLLQSDARLAAAQDARARAKAQAEVLGVTLKELLVSNEPAPTEPLDASGCAPLHGANDDQWWTPGSVGLTVPPFDPQAVPAVTLDLQVTLAYAITEAPNGGADATSTAATS
jgi:uncharacterized protein YggE